MRKYMVLRKSKPFIKGDILEFDEETKMLTSVKNPMIKMSIDTANALGVELINAIDNEGANGRYLTSRSVLKNLRLQLNMTQEDFAAKTEISRTSIVNIEAGTQHPSLAQLQKMLNRLGYILILSAEKVNQ